MSEPSMAISLQRAHSRGSICDGSSGGWFPEWSVWREGKQVQRFEEINSQVKVKSKIVSGRSAPDMLCKVSRCLLMQSRDCGMWEQGEACLGLTKELREKGRAVALDS